MKIKEFIFKCTALERSVRNQATRGLALGAFLLGSSLPGSVTFAEEVIEEQVVTGVRGKPRTVKDSPVPIDVFNSEAVEDVAFSDMNDMYFGLVLEIL